MMSEGPWNSNTFVETILEDWKLNKVKLCSLYVSGEKELHWASSSLNMTCDRAR